MLTFLYISPVKQHLFSIEISLEKQLLPGYPTNPETIGDHIRKQGLTYASSREKSGKSSVLLNLRSELGTRRGARTAL